MSCQTWDNTLLNKIKEAADFLLQAIANIIHEFYEQYQIYSKKVQEIEAKDYTNIIGFKYETPRDVWNVCNLKYQLMLLEIFQSIQKVLNQEEFNEFFRRLLTDPTSFIRTRQIGNLNWKCIYQIVGAYQKSMGTKQEAKTKIQKKYFLIKIQIKSTNSNPEKTLQKVSISGYDSTQEPNLELKIVNSLSNLLDGINTQELFEKLEQSQSLSMNVILTSSLPINFEKFVTFAEADKKLDQLLQDKHIFDQAYYPKNINTWFDYDLLYHAFYLDDGSDLLDLSKVIKNLIEELNSEEAKELVQDLTGIFVES